MIKSINFIILYLLFGLSLSVIDIFTIDPNDIGVHPIGDPYMYGFGVLVIAAGYPTSLVYVTIGLIIIIKNTFG